MSLNSLPDELLFEIAYRCDFKSILNTKQSCQYLFKLFGSRLFWERKLEYSKDKNFCVNINKYFDKIDWKMCVFRIDRFENVYTQMGYNIWSNKEYYRYWELMYEFETKKKNIFHK